MKKRIMLCGLVGIFIFAGAIVASDLDSLCYTRTFEKESCDQESWSRLLAITNSLCALDRYDKTEKSERLPVKGASRALNFVLDQLKTPWLSESDGSITWTFRCDKKNEHGEVDENDWKMLVEVGKRIREMDVSGPVTIESVAAELEFILNILEQVQHISK